MNRNHQSQNTLNHTPHGRQNIARQQMGKGMRTPSRYNPKEVQRTIYYGDDDTSFNLNQDFNNTKDYSFDAYSGNSYERAYQEWTDETDVDKTDYSNYRSEGPRPVEIQARDKYTHAHVHNLSPDFHGRSLSDRALSEMNYVDNNFLIQSFKGIGPKGYVRSDERIEDEVCEMLTRNNYIDASSIYVAVDKGLVKLSGTVRSRQEKFEIEDAVENVSGVNEVQNEIRIQKILK